MKNAILWCVLTNKTKQKIHKHKTAIQNTCAAVVGEWRIYFHY